MPQTDKSPASVLAPQQGTRSHRFVTRLIISVVLINMLAIIYAGSTLYSSKKESVLAAETRSRTIARAVDQSITSNVDKIDIALQILVREAEAQLAQGTLQPNTLLQSLKQQQLMLPESAGCRIFDATGHIVAAVGILATALPQLDISQRSYFLDLKSGSAKGLYISPPLRSLVSEEVAVLFVRRINNPAGQFAGLVLVPVKVEYFSQLMQHFDLTSSDATTLRYRDLSMIVRYPPYLKDGKPVDASPNLSDELRQTALSGVTEGVFHSISPSDQIKRIKTFHRVSNAPFVIIGEVWEKEYLRPWYRQVWQTVGFLIMFMLLSFFLAGMVLHYWRKQLDAICSLSDSRDQLDSAQAVGHLGTYVFDIANGTGIGTASLYSIVGLSLESNINFDLWETIIYPDDRYEVRRRLGQAIESQEPNFSIEYRIVRKNDGMICWILDLTKFEYTVDGTMLRMSGVIQDIGERKLAEERLRLTQEVFLHTNEGIFVTDSQGQFLEINPAYTQMSGYSLQDVQCQMPLFPHSGLCPQMFLQRILPHLQQMGRWEGELQSCRKDGSLYIQFARISSVLDNQGNISRFIGIASDVTELREIQSRVEYLAYFDKLTDLPNRIRFIDSLQQAMDNLQLGNESIGVCYLDLDGFKLVNDEWGHSASDAILQQVGTRLQSAFGQSGLVARIGGDDFVVLLKHLQGENALLSAIDQLHNLFVKPFLVEQVSAKLTISVGATLYPRDGGESPEVMIRNANQAMCIAKLAGKNRSHLFDVVNQRRLRDNQNLFARVLMAYEQNEFQLYYQPKVDMYNGQVIGVEALIRWVHPQQGLITPEAFLPLVENTEFSITLGEWVMRQAMRQMKIWSTAGLVLPVSINVSGYHLQRSDFVSRLAQILDEYPGVKPDWLELEILETSAMEDLDQIALLLQACMALGVNFALDDFGTGYSSLTYLRRLPTKTLKIDRSFVIEILTSSMDQALVAGIVALGHSLTREVIAEGVESLEHGIPLLRMGCHLVQGYGISRPMMADEVQDWVAQWRMPEIWKNCLSEESQQAIDQNQRAFG